MNGDPFINERFGRIDERLKPLEKTFSEFHGLKRGLLIAGIVLAIGITILGIFLVSYFRDTARTVVREELQFIQTITQPGAFKDENRVSVDPPAFHWALKQPIDPMKVIMASAAPDKPIAGVAVSAVLDNDGKGCTMTLFGDKDTISALQLPIPATLTIVTKPIPAWPIQK